jgi:hypothetical protein
VNIAGESALPVQNRRRSAAKTGANVNQSDRRVTRREISACSQLLDGEFDISGEPLDE